MLGFSGVEEKEKKRKGCEKVNPKDKSGNEKGVAFSLHTLCIVQEIVAGNDTKCWTVLLHYIHFLLSHDFLTN